MALQEESGKTDLNLDFKTVGVVSEDQIKRQSAFIKNQFASAFAAGETSYVKYGETISEITKYTDDARKRMSTASKSMFGVFQGLVGQLQNGVITSKEFTSQIEILTGQLDKLPSAAKSKIVSSMFANMDKDAKDAAKGITDVNDKLKTMLALSLGVIGSDDSILKSLKSSSQVVREYYSKLLSEKIKKFYQDLDKAVVSEKVGTIEGSAASGNGTDILSKQAKLAIARLQKELDLLKTKRDTVKDTNDELKRQYEYQQKLMQLQQDATQAKISGNYIGAAIIEQQKSFQLSEFNKETASLALDKKITTLENRISALTAGARVTNAETALNKAKANGKAMGGLIKGPGTGTSDSIGARFARGGLPELRVSNGEYIVKAASVKNYGVGFMDALNNQNVGISNSTTSSGSTVYNIDMTINGGNSNPSEIADQVIRRLKVESSKNNKSNKVMM